jgi:hypothetical protein
MISLKLYIELATKENPMKANKQCWIDSRFNSFAPKNAGRKINRFFIH